MSPLRDNAAVTEAKRVLIVEDEAILAFALEESLVESGFEVAGIAGKLETALDMIENRTFDAVVLDANLAGVGAGPAARALKVRGIPFVVVSGYLEEQLHSDFAGAVCIQKPCLQESITDELHRLLS